MTENGAIRLRSARKIGNRESLMRGSRIRGPFVFSMDRYQVPSEARKMGIGRVGICEDLESGVRPGGRGSA